jgi:hypothetical protein
MMEERTMKLRNIFALILALLFCAAMLTACGGDGGNGETRPEATLPALDRPEGMSAGESGTQAEQGTLPAAEDGEDGPTVPKGNGAFVPGESKNGEPESVEATEPASDPANVPTPPATEPRTNPSPKPGTTQEEEDSNENLPVVPSDDEDEDDSVENLVVDDDEDEDSRQNLG